LEKAIAGFIQHYNEARYHGSLDNVTAVDVYFGRAECILKERDQVKICTLAACRRQTARDTSRGLPAASP
jgi:putative transposase